MCRLATTRVNWFRELVHVFHILMTKNGLKLITEIRTPTFNQAIESLELQISAILMFDIM